jgi:uncharacterized protein (TIGR02646 family)
MRKIKPYFYIADEPIELWTDASKKRNRIKPNNPNGDSKIELALSQRSAHIFDREVYGSTAVKDKLKTIFKCKCAFCETNTHAGAHKDVEHFRNKIHYYWLGYEWTNLLLSCQICNRDFKGTLFPLQNDADRITSHPLNRASEFDRRQCRILSKSLKSEKRLLLHPAIDNPKKHLKFLSNGLVKGLTPKGKKSVEIYGLERDELRKAREKIVFQMRKDILEEYKETPPDVERIALEIRKVIRKLIERIENEESEYIGFSTAILENFEAFIIDNRAQGIDMPDKDIMRQAARAALVA